MGWVIHRWNLGDSGQAARFGFEMDLSHSKAMPMHI